MPSIKYRRYGDGSDMDTFEGIPCHEVTKYLYEFYVWYKSNCTFRTYLRSVSNKKAYRSVQKSFIYEVTWKYE